MSEDMKRICFDLTVIIPQFYCEEHGKIGERFARFAFCKDVETLRKAGERLQGLKKYLKQ